MNVLGFKPDAIPNKNSSSFVIFDKTNFKEANMTDCQTFFFLYELDIKSIKQRFGVMCLQLIVLKFQTYYYHKHIYTMT